MSMTEDKLLMAFETMYSSARAAQNAGQYNKAKRDYYKAAEYMTELAKQSSASLRAARIERVKRIVAIADALPESAPKKATAKKPAPEEDDETCASFKAAEIPDVSFDDVKGLEAAKEAIRIKMIYPMEHADVYKALGKSSGGGVLLYGPPGTGKTMLAKAAAHEARAVFYSVKCSDIVSKWVGESEKNIAGLFETARSNDRAIIFFDELDSLFFKRGTDVHNDRRVNELLQQIDGFSGRKAGLMILGATNNPWAVDDAAMRPGRFSQKVYIPLPDEPARAAMISSRLKKTKTDGEIDVDGIVAATDGFSGADIAELIDRATDAPLRRSLASGSVSGLTRADIDDALKTVRPSVDRATVEKFERYDG
ncbi:MAG: ATP-binding protein [Clostridiales bacterium]|nr:ATP-binding protein [Clostridiales bacterium]